MPITTLKPDINATLSGGGAGGTAQADKSSFTEGTDQVTPISGVYNDSLGADPTEDTTVALRATVKRALHTNPRNSAGTEIATLTNPIRVDPTGSTTQPVSGTITAAQSTAANLKATVTIVDGAGDSAMDNTNDALRVNVVAGGAGDGAILDGVSASIKATVLDYVNSNPLAVRLTDTNGDYVSAGGGTQYTEDDAAPANPVGNALIARRRDSLSSETTTDGDITALNSTAKGELYVKHVDAVPASQSGTWNINNISGTISLPTGAATAAKQPALGTAGSPSADVITVQGTVSMTALKVDGSAVTQPVSGTVTANIGTTNGLALDATIGRAQGSTTSGQTGPLVQGAVTTSAPSYTTAQTSPLSLTTAGALRVDGSAVTQPVSGTVTANAGTGNFGANITQVGGNTVNAGTGNSGTGTLRVVIATDQPQLTNKLLVTPDANSSVNLSQVSGTTTATGNGTASAGCQRVTIASDNTAFTTNAAQSGTWTVQPGNTANTTPWLIQDVPATSGGLTTHLTISAASTNATNVKGSAGQVYSIQVFNSNASVRYFKLYNKSTSPTVGTDTPIKVFTIPAGGGVAINIDKGIACSSGIGFATTTGAANSDTGAVAANEIIVNIDYK